MVVARFVATVLALPALALGAAACSGDPPPAAAPSQRPVPTPGGPTVAAASPPARPMTRLERPVASRLARVAALQGLHLDYLHCPRWDHAMPGRLTCTGWFDGVTADVEVRLRQVAGGSLEFEARIGHGVVATRTLVRRIEQHGATDVDCGSTPAYPARVGLKVVCATGPAAHRHYVVATVTDPAGSVEIVDY